MNAHDNEPTNNEPANTEFTDEEYADLITEWMSTLKAMREQGEGFQNVNRGEGLALFLLENADGSLSAGELSDLMHLTTGRMANILRQLESKNYVMRSHDPTNRRKTIISLTEEGREHVDVMYVEAKRRAVEVVKKLGRKDTEELIRIFKKLAEIGKDG